MRFKIGNKTLEQLFLVRAVKAGGHTPLEGLTAFWAFIKLRCGNILAVTGGFKLFYGVAEYLTKRHFGTAKLDIAVFVARFNRNATPVLNELNLAKA